MAEETEVRRGGGADAPVEFRWNGQIHRVREVLTHHRIRNPPRSGSPTRPDLPPSPAVVDELEARRAARAAEPPPEPPEPMASTRPPDEEVWRVLAGPSALRPAPALAGVFDLRFDWTVGRWTVTRIDILEEEL